ncbi:MAG: ABC transporter ATP-binding protein [Pseudanabaena sp.]|jgi:putative ABC transport system ATP-binding protein|nr:ABC transporter ATP-binding protein [Pseudanabaena sp. M53BS1SP1A06MG]MCA6580931.1 ABC transporter ATP-binding protein [Pseudanabaena sp. M34BS1SP1A06MG]MCA6585674.1 ABC transporter ATP-binding protein [Pseudanabaena sp. M051S1SP1A06QC]MCA6589357.1 ABC transporter ATP-binding protein [Pseudanabaena sp. M109S1SP1A06QC]MCA6590817.1 ABC transporter ATP-binding protein [Pseudanabaena sp. M38BS1SP1A06MG]MCA6598861.1 ABC transporter ATP-binding protein [Pseudanabaena sp. M57BS1SP1A06MG]MCA660613
MLTNELITPIPSISDSRREIVRLNEVCKYYGQDDTLVKALDNVSFVIKQGEYCAIMGVSGSGKSTCMNIIGCLDSTTSGQYFLDEEDVSDMEEKDLAKVRNLKIGFVFQQYHLLPQLTALENVMLPMAYANVRPKEQKERAAAALERVAMGHRLNNRPNQMSGGQQQRVAIARALVNNPVMLLADEPTGALDSHTTAEVIELFGKLNDSGITVVMVTHEADVARNTQRIIWFRDGQIINDRLSPNDLNHVI